MIDGPGQLYVGRDSSWRFEISDAHDMPYCSGLPVGNIGGCYRASN